MNVRKIKAILVALAIGAVGALGATVAQADATPGQPVAAGPTMTVVPVARPWVNGTVPPELHLWATVHEGRVFRGVKADRWARESDPRGKVRRGCAVATGDTSLIMCPDGYYAYS